METGNDDIKKSARLKLPSASHRYQDSVFHLFASLASTIGSNTASVMSAQREPNPLRPYYVPPSIGPSTSAPPQPSSAPNISSKYGAPPSSTSFGSSARNILADMDYSDIISDNSPAATDILRRLAQQAIWKYSSVFLAQPLEVSKTVLQVHVASSRPQRRKEKDDKYAADERRKQAVYRQDSYDVYPP